MSASDLSRVLENFQRVSHPPQNTKTNQFTIGSPTTLPLKYSISHTARQVLRFNKSLYLLCIDRIEDMCINGFHFCLFFPLDYFLPSFLSCFFFFFFSSFFFFFVRVDLIHALYFIHYIKLKRNFSTVCEISKKASLGASSPPATFSF